LINCNEPIDPEIRPCELKGNASDYVAVVPYSSRSLVVDQRYEEDAPLGRRAMDKFLARLASRTTADIDQAGAMPAIVILGDNNTVCLGDAFLELLKHMRSAETPPHKKD
jgi:hypothetical protein